MDIIAIVSVIGVFAVVVVGILTGGGVIMWFYDPGSIFIVVVGAVLAGISSFPMGQIMSALKAVGIAFRKLNTDLNNEVDIIIEIANIARKDGLLALEERVKDLDDPFLKKGIMLITDGSDPELIRDIMETELDFMSQRHAQIQGVFEQLAAYSPAFGMLGTLVGLVIMLKNMGDDVGAIGPAMAVALITTFYGVILANALFTPIARRLKAASTQEYLRKELLLEGLLSIQDGENPRIIKDKLEAFIARSEIGGGKKAEKKEG